MLGWLIAIWCILGVISFFWSAVKCDMRFFEYGFAHFLFWVVLGPIGIIVTLLEE